MTQEAFRVILRDQNGNTNVPYVNWNGDKLKRNANWLDNKWNENDRVLLLDTFIFLRQEFILAFFVDFLQADFSNHIEFYLFLLF